MHIFKNYILYFTYLLPISNARKLLSIVTSTKKINANSNRKKLLIDVSIIMKNDAGTGIQRTVKEIFLELMKLASSEYDICPVYATKKYSYRYADKLSFCESQFNHSDKSFVYAKFGDVFLGLDLSTNILYHHRFQLMKWKLSGVKIHTVMYDLLPLTHPDFFSKSASENYKRWIKVVSLVSDVIICISKTTQERYNDWLKKENFNTKNIPLSQVIPMGANINLGRKKIELNECELKYFEKFTLLMVGTIEPRKGHKDILKAFKKIWSNNNDINLVIVGRAGWKTDQLQSQMQELMRTESKFKWYENASDELVSCLYTKASGVIAASYDEGFGLPIMEATFYGKPVLARNIAVFKEISGNNVSFFDEISSYSLDEQILFWVSKIKENGVMTFKGKYYSTWSETAQSLMKIINSN